MVKIEITRDIHGFIEKSTVESHDPKDGVTISTFMALVDQALAGMGYSDTVIKKGHEEALND